MGFETTRLWQTTLAERPNDPASVARTRLREGFLTLRERGTILAREIARDFPSLTVHDDTHMDALWELSDLICGPEYKLTPSEAFVLGASFVLHDLGLSLAAYPGGRSQLQADPRWKDLLIENFRRALGHFPLESDLRAPPETVVEETDRDLLRVLHAERAEHLAFASWGEYHLIENPDLRANWGQLIGKIAHSHSWSIEQVRTDLSISIGSLGRDPHDWTVDPLAVACILRAADACHLDDRRAPGFEREIRKPTGTAAHHWTFQRWLRQPELKHGRLHFTSTHEFEESEASAWWLCFETLRMADRELADVNALLADTNRSQFMALSISGVDSPERLRRLVPTANWKPVEAEIHVSDVPALVMRFGGEHLYGKDLTVPVRELIQNGCDAVRARRVLEHRDNKWGSVTVRLFSSNGADWLEVEDTGVGMSETVLTKTLLNFGQPFWGTRSVQDEFPGLIASRFEATGRFGIGFFSVFMLGDFVQVTTRRFDEALRDSRTLVFNEGLGSRPLLRPAKEDEWPRDGGTKVLVRLKTGARETGGILRSRVHFGEPSLVDLCRWLCPALEIDLIVDEGLPKKVISAGDWREIDGEAFVRRLSGIDAGCPDALVDMAHRLRFVVGSDGAPVGRACVVTEIIRDVASTGSVHRRFGGCVTVGGLCSIGINGLCGILVGEPTRAARDVAVPIVPLDQLREWASEQADLVFRHPIRGARDGEQTENAVFVRALGGDPGDLPAIRVGDDLCCVREAGERLAIHSEILVVQDLSFVHEERTTGKIILDSNVAVCAMGIPDILQPPFLQPILWPPYQTGDRLEVFLSKTIVGALVEALARKWRSTIWEIFEASDFKRSGTSQIKSVGKSAETGIRTSLYAMHMIRRPGVRA